MALLLTLPAACLDVLDWQKCDQAVVLTDGDVFWSLHPLEEAGEAAMFAEGCTDRILVKQSGGALLAVLARHLGWDGSGRLLLHREYGGRDRGYVWSLCRLESQGGRSPVEALLEWLPEHIGVDLDYFDALAEAVVWFARVARLAAWDSAVAEGYSGTLYRACAVHIGDEMPGEAQQLAWVETHHDWPTWAASGQSHGLIEPEVTHG